MKLIKFLILLGFLIPNLLAQQVDYGTQVKNKNFTQTGTGAVARTIESKLKDTVSVKDFGAVGDGVVDDSGAFTTAIAAVSDGAEIQVPCGTYLFSSKVTINKHLILRGSGVCSVIKGTGITVLEVSASMGSAPVQIADIKISDPTGHASTIGIKDLGVGTVYSGVHIIGTSSAKLGVGLQLYNSVSTTIENGSTFQYWNKALEAAGDYATAVGIHGSAFLGSNYGIYATVATTSLTGINLVGSTLDNNTSGFYCGVKCGATVVGNHFENADHEIELDGGTVNAFGNGYFGAAAAGGNAITLASGSKLTAFGDRANVNYTNNGDSSTSCFVIVPTTTYTYAGTGPCTLIEPRGIYYKNYENNYTLSLGGYKFSVVGTIEATSTESRANIPVCSTYTVASTNAAFQAASTTATVALVTLPAKAILIAPLDIKHSVQFSDGGGAMTDVSVSIGSAGGGATYYLAAKSIGEVTTVSDTALYSETPAKYRYTAASEALNAVFTSTGRDFGDGAGATYLTGGSVDITACWFVKP